MHGQTRWPTSAGIDRIGKCFWPITTPIAGVGLGLSLAFEVDLSAVGICTGEFALVCGVELLAGSNNSDSTFGVMERPLDGDTASACGEGDAAGVIVVFDSLPSICSDHAELVVAAAVSC